MNVSISADYPVTPPSITFESKIFHPNVKFETGEICLDILKREWSPAWSVEVTMSLFELLVEKKEMSTHVPLFVFISGSVPSYNIIIGATGY